MEDFACYGRFTFHSIVCPGNDPSFTDESGGTELRQFDTTGVDAAKIQLELIEFQ